MEKGSIEPKVEESLFRFLVEKDPKDVWVSFLPLSGAVPRGEVES